MRGFLIKKTIYIRTNMRYTEIPNKITNELYLRTQNKRGAKNRKIFYRRITKTKMLKATSKVLELLRKPGMMIENTTSSILLIDASLNELKAFRRKLENQQLSYREILYAYHLLKNLLILTSKLLITNTFNLPRSISTRLIKLEYEARSLLNEIRRKIP